MYRLMFGVLLLIVMSASPASALGDCADCDFDYNRCVIDADQDADTALAVGGVVCLVVTAKNPAAGAVCFFGLGIAVRDFRANAKWDCYLDKEECEADCNNKHKNPRNPTS